jgi:hypothetical protein
MPETAIDEYGDALPPKNDVRASSVPLERRRVDTEPQTHPVERGPKFDFGRCIATPRGEHPRARSLRGCAGP